MIKETRHIDLHLPTGWNQATTEELEHIAAAIIYAQQRQDRYHPFDWAQVKLMAVLAINDIEIVSIPDEDADVDISDVTYMVKRKDDQQPWPISLGTLHALCEQLEWISDEKAAKTVFLFPYPELTITNNHKSITVIGPPPLLDGYTWQEYRWLCDWMQEYLRVANTGGDTTEARSHFLATLFKPKATASVSAIDAKIFADFDLIKWQVVLFWWSSLMGQLAKKFPKVFKQQGIEKGRKPKNDTPWDFYNRVIATIQKYVGGLSEQDVNTASYGTILQQLDMMAREAEEMERLNKKYKH